MPPPTPLYEPFGGFDFLYTVLNPLATIGGAHLGVAPIGTLAPFTVYSQQSGTDLMEIAGYRVWNNGLYLVKACGPATQADAIMVLAAANDAALQRTGGIAVSGGTGLMLSCTREQTIIQPETITNSMQWLNVGGFYRIYVQQAQ